MDSRVQLPIFLDVVNRLRRERKTLGQVLLTLERITSGGAGGELRTAWESIWCTLKHLTTALIHVDECIEKVVKLAEERGSAELGLEAASLLRVRRSLLECAVELVRRARANANLLTEPGVRCREDFCLEAEEADGK